MTWTAPGVARDAFALDQPECAALYRGDDDWDLVDPGLAEHDYQQLIDTWALVDAVAERYPLDATFTRPRETWSIRGLYLHPIEELARHNGHADLLREAVDGATGE